MEKPVDFEESGVSQSAFGVGSEVETQKGVAAVVRDPDINPDTPEAIRPWLFQKGKSGNPKGRPRRTDTNGVKVDRRTLYKQLFDQGAADVIAAMIEAAKKGDVKAGAVVMRYLMPENKAVMEAVDLGLPDNAPLEERLAALTQAVTDGRVSPDAAAAVAKSLRDATESAKLLEAMSRMDALKKEIGRINGTSR